MIELCRKITMWIEIPIVNYVSNFYRKVVTVKADVIKSRDKSCCVQRCFITTWWDTMLICHVLLQNYLKKFGYLETVQRSGFQSMVSTSKALVRLQRQLGLEETGKLDKPTLNAMRQPRCGVPDVANYRTFDGDLKWDHNDVTYRWAKKKSQWHCDAFEL